MQKNDEKLYNNNPGKCQRPYENSNKLSSRYLIKY